MALPVIEPEFLPEIEIEYDPEIPSTKRGSESNDPLSGMSDNYQFFEERFDMAISAFGNGDYYPLFSNYEAMDYYHPDIKPKVQFTNTTGGDLMYLNPNGWYYGMAWASSDPRSGAWYEHGTHTAGIITGNTFRTGVPNARLAFGSYFGPNSHLPDGSSTSLLSWVEWAIENNIRVVSMSLGGGTYTQESQDAFLLAYENGIFMVASAGNSPLEVGVDFDKYPCMYDGVFCISSESSYHAYSTTHVDFSTTAHAISTQPGPTFWEQFIDNATGDNYDCGGGDGSCIDGGGVDWTCHTSYAYDCSGCNNEIQNYWLDQWYDNGSQGCSGQGYLPEEGDCNSDIGYCQYTEGLSINERHYITQRPVGSSYLTPEYNITLSCEVYHYGYYGCDLEAGNCNMIGGDSWVHPGTGETIDQTWCNHTLMAGTSQSTPKVAALALLLLSHKEDLTPDQIVDILASSAVDSDNINKYGQVDPFGAVQYLYENFDISAESSMGVNECVETSSTSRTTFKYGTKSKDIRKQILSTKIRPNDTVRDINPT
jgi:subtilisin family serine protease